MKICSVFGHREIEITSELREKVFKTFEEVIKKGCRVFYFGGFGDFDKLCWQIITELREEYKDIKRVFCLTDVKHLNAQKRPKFLKESDYEEFKYLELSFEWWYQRIYFRNCAMVDESDIIIFYVYPKENSGAYKTYKYALKKKKHLINLK